jgi:hypothetical protein
VPGRCLLTAASIDAVVGSMITANLAGLSPEAPVADGRQSLKPANPQCGLVLMCDEPTGNLDTATTQELADLLESLHREGATLLVITHNPAVAGRAQRTIAIRDGELTEDPLAGGTRAFPGS